MSDDTAEMEKELEEDYTDLRETLSDDFVEFAHRYCITRFDLTEDHVPTREEDLDYDRARQGLSERIKGNLAIIGGQLVGYDGKKQYASVEEFVNRFYGAALEGIGLEIEMIEDNNDKQEFIEKFSSEIEHWLDENDQSIDREWGTLRSDEGFYIEGMEYG